ncbi:hypothetical protein GCM10020001_058560 [Nonomuraea salmonea]
MRADSEIRTPCPVTYCFFSAFTGSAGAACAGAAVTNAADDASASPATIRFIGFPSALGKNEEQA